MPVRQKATNGLINRNFTNERIRSIWGLIIVMGIIGIMSSTKADQISSTKNKTNLEVWKEVDIVPMPKEIKLSGKQWCLNDEPTTCLVLGDSPSEQSIIGAQWINQELKKLGTAPLKISKESKLSDSGTSIIIGTVADSPLIKTAVKTGTVNVGPKNPGLKGYEIRIDKTKKHIYLAGADPVGALYACVTFAELLESRHGKVVWREAEVRDWPDFTNMILGGYSSGTTECPEIHSVWSAVMKDRITPDIKKKYLRNIKNLYDQMLRWKVPLFHYTSQKFARYPRHRHASAESKALLREGIEYGKKRGVGAMFYALKPFVCLKKDHPEIPDDCANARSEKYGDWIRCWSLDDQRRQYARELAQWIKECGYTEISFHDSDTGGLTNPAGWNQRCERCKKRWGDDYTAAIANKAKIYYEEIKKIVPDVSIHFVFYPYQLHIIDQEMGEQLLRTYYGDDPSHSDTARKYRKKYTTHWERLNQLLPKDLSFAIRENSPKVIKLYRDLCPDHGVYTGFGALSKPWTCFVSSAPAWLQTFYKNDRDILFPMYLGPANGFLDIQPLIIREYAWNVNAPGSEPYARHTKTEKERWQFGEQKGELYSVVLPHVVRNYFGKAIAPDVTDALRQNVNPGLIFEELPYSRYKYLATFEKMKWQMELAKKASKSLEQAWGKLKNSDNWLGLNDSVLLRFVYLRETMESCAWLAKIRSQNMHARKLAKAQKSNQARTAIKDGLSMCTQARQAITSLIKERPDIPHLPNLKKVKRIKRFKIFYVYMAGAAMKKIDELEQRLKNSAQEIDALAKSSGIPSDILGKLSKGQIIRSVETAQPPKIDGHGSEQVWNTAYPIESFLIHKKDKTVANAQTRTKLLHDKDNLYLCFQCRPIGSAEISDQDRIELFLKSPGMKGDYVHFILKNTGKEITQQRVRMQKNLLKTWETDNSWQADEMVFKHSVNPEFWEVEIKLPWSSLNTKPGEKCFINLCRACPAANGIEWSSIIPPDAKNFHDFKKFPVIHWTKSHYIPSISLEIKKPERSTVTMSDRVATVITFGVTVNSNVILHNLSLKAEGFGPSGSTQGRKTLFSKPSLLYKWNSEQPLSLEFQEPCAKGGMLLTLTSDEGTASTWYRFGGWKGTGTKGKTLVPTGKNSKKKVNNFWTKPDNLALAQPCFFPSMIQCQNQQFKLFNRSAGCVEFWINPSWNASWKAPYIKHELRGNDAHCFLSMGPVVGKSPFFKRILAIGYSHGNFWAAIGNTDNVKWHTSYNVKTCKNWSESQWHHFAVVWETNAKRDDWLRFYIDGHRVAGLTTISHEERLKNKSNIDCRCDVPYSVQIGTNQNGGNHADALIDELRISQTARYNEDFNPCLQELKSDNQTTALFHFNKELDGEGITPDGVKYKIPANSGVVGW